MTNTKNHYRLNAARYALSALMLAALAACGGGGGGDSSPTPAPDNGVQTTETEVETQSLACAAGQTGAITQERTNTRIRTDYTTGNPTYSAWTNGAWQTVSDTCTTQDDGTLDTPNYSGEKLEGFNEINRVRTLVGLKPMKQNIKLDIAAQGHADYLAINNTGGHRQIEGNTGFTGVTSQDRAKAAGYTLGVHEGIGYGGTVLQKVTEQIDTVYHRKWVLDSRFVDVGIGQADKSLAPEDSASFYVPPVVFSPGYVSYWSNIPQHEPVYWPTNGAINVPTRFNNGVGENPDPAPDLGAQNTGYPLSVNIPGDKEWTTEVTFTLTCSGQPVTARLLTKHTDKNNPDNLWANFAFLLPESPLPQNASCTANFSGTYTGDTGGKVEKTWTFSTGNI